MVTCIQKKEKLQLNKQQTNKFSATNNNKNTGDNAAPA